jgi:Protein of unknown function (DUF2726)
VETLLSLTGSPDTLIFLIVFLAVLGALVPRIFRTKPKWRQPHRRQIARPSRNTYAPAVRVAEPTNGTEASYAAEQLRAVMTGTFTAKNVLSRTEASVMQAAEKAIAEAGLNWRVMAQVALGEILASPSEDAFRAINAKRVDLLVVSAKSEPLAAIEYQGQGHYQGTAPARDAIKKEALRKAGIRYIEITYEHGPEDVKREINRMAWLGKPRNNHSEKRITVTN